MQNTTEFSHVAHFVISSSTRESPHCLVHCDGVCLLFFSPVQLSGISMPNIARKTRSRKRGREKESFGCFTNVDRQVCSGCDEGLLIKNSDAVKEVSISAIVLNSILAMTEKSLVSGKNILLKHP